MGIILELWIEIGDELKGAKRRKMMTLELIPDDFYYKLSDDKKYSNKINQRKSGKRKTA
jgi:hypothetical protein